MGIMAIMHKSAQALHMDALCQKRLSTDKDLKESKGEFSTPDNHAIVL